MNAFDIEKFRHYLLHKLSQTHGKAKTLILFEFYKTLFDCGNNILINAYLHEFLDELINSLKIYSGFCIKIEKSEELLSTLQKVIIFTDDPGLRKILYKESERIKNQLDELKCILDGSLHSKKFEKISFPLIEEIGNSDEEAYGFIETVKININKSKTGDKIFVFPNSGTIDKNIETQIKDSFALAIQYLSKHRRKFNTYHELFIYFENFSADYIGNSLGIALTVGFIEQLCRLYNLPFLIHINSNISSTGAVDEGGNIKPVSKEIIEKKVECVFYSPIETFIVPKSDEEYAIQKAEVLRAKYPGKKLKIIGVADIEDIFNRRNLISISKQNPVYRTAKSAVKNWPVSLIVIVLYIITALTLIRNFDDNPAFLEYDEFTLKAFNKNGRILWAKNYDGDKFSISSNINLNRFWQLIDIDLDGKNETIMANGISDENNDSTFMGGISCYNYLGDVIWKFNLTDYPNTSNSWREEFSYRLIDTTSNRTAKLLVGMACNNPAERTAFFKVNLLTGKLMGDVYFHNEIIKDAKLVDFNSETEPKIAFIGTDNITRKLQLD